VENAAHAHLLAGEALAPGAAHAGRAYFIGQEEPVQLWPWINELLAGLDIAPVRRRISQASAYRLGAVLEAIWRTLRLGGEPPMTRFVATQLATSHSYDMAPAQRDFGYQQLISGEEALERTLAELR
jgi:nucleoside-diphosphate-sugar epimerase